jgi:AhpD family alkylhydroperoxidase
MTTTARHLRFSMAELAREAYRAMAAFDRSIDFDPHLRELVKVRASQLNHCAYCIDMHTREARRLGETERRLYALAAWRESPLFNERERAVLALTEAVTLVASAGVPDEVHELAARFFEPSELAQLVMAISAINSWNRIAVSSGMTFEAPEDGAPES